ncbi:MAG: bifunctional DNA primase/polymerase [Vulcanimicrobiota bacterium]
MNIQEYIQAYLEKGFDIVPCEPNAKLTYKTGWTNKKFSIDEFSLDGNIGMKTGNELICLDLDYKGEKEKDPSMDFAKELDQRLDLNTFCYQRTAHDRRHIILGITTKGKFHKRKVMYKGMPVDVLGNSSMFLIEPSKIDGNEYKIFILNEILGQSPFDRFLNREYPVLTPKQEDKLLEWLAELEGKETAIEKSQIEHEQEKETEKIKAILKNCTELNKLHQKIKTEHHLTHDERIHFVNVFKVLPGGHEFVLSCLKMLSDYDPSKTDCQIKSLKGNPTLCKTLCQDHLCDEIKIIGKKSPVAFAYSASNSKPDVPSFPEDCYVGIAGDFAAMYDNVFEAPKEFFYFSFLTHLGCLISPYVSLKSSLLEPPRLYTVIIAKTAVQRKSVALEITSKFFDDFTKNFRKIEGTGSAEGLAEVIKKTGLPVIIMLDELKAFVQKAKQDGSMLLPMINTLFSKSSYDNYTKGHSIEIKNGFLSILSACTDSTFENMWTPQFPAC